MESSQPLPQRLGRFEILRPLGKGGMGQVFLARDPSIGREVALKTISSDAVQTEKARERFLHEAKAAGALSHGNLVTIHEFGEDRGTLFLVMEYLEGEDLSALLRRRALAPAQALEIMAQVCDGLAYAHAKGVLHRDVKPSNVRVIEQSGRLLAKLMDFGVARLPDSQLTATGDRVGTLSYMAPEYLRGMAPTVQCDLYPVGMMLYEALTGELPALGPTLPRGLPRPASTGTVTELPARFAPLLGRALAADPAGRFPSAEAFAAALRAAAKHGAEPSARLALPPVTAPEPASHAMLAWTALAILGAGGLAWALWPQYAMKPAAPAPPAQAQAQSTAAAVGPPAAPAPPVSQPATPPAEPAPAAPAPDPGTDLSSAETTVKDRPQLALIDAERQLHGHPSDARAHALRVASLYWLRRYPDMLPALQDAQRAGVSGDQLGGFGSIHGMLDAEREARSIPRDLFQQLRPYLPTPREGQGGPSSPRRPGAKDAP